jgi:transglutaminase-like putative cysteine protease
MLMMLSIAWSMELASWVEGLYVVEWAALSGLALGFVMTRLGWSRALSHLVSSVIGASLILAVVSRFIVPGFSWRTALGMIAYHFDAWLRVAISGQSSTDAVIFILLIALLGWWIGYACAWMVFGAHKVWQALALSGAAMLLVAYASPPEVGPFFVMYVFCALLLAVRVYVYTQEESWAQQHARYDRDIALHFLRDGGILVLGIVTVVWVVPLISSSASLVGLWGRVEGPWRTIGDEWNRLFSGVLGYSRGYENVPFGERLTLGGPLKLDEDILMWVSTNGARYWRGVVYDRYDGRGWVNTDTLSAVVPPNRDVTVEAQYEMRRLIEQTVMPNWSGVGQVFYLGEFLSINVPAQVEYSHAGGSGIGADPWSAPSSVSTVETRIPVNVDRPYLVSSYTSVADATSLREASTDYPEWVVPRYLQLPSTLPERVAELAQEVAGPQGNPYDQAVAIQDYLRRTIEYREDIEAPPEDRDAIDYLLYDSRVGYCNYYASAMVVMARAVGIPARLVVGYAGGELDEEAARYVVRRRDTHAWVEVFFPGFGWVEFEPTASEPLITRPETSDDSELGPPGGEIESRLERDLGRLEAEEEGSLGAPIPFARTGGSSFKGVALAAVVLCGGAGVLAIWVFNRRRVEETSVVGKIYRRMCQYARLLGITGYAYQTPYEYAAVMGDQLPQAASPARQISELFVRDQFSAQGVELTEERAAEQAWQALRPVVLRRLLRRPPELLRAAFRLHS